MKKLLSVVLSIVMVLGMVMPMGVMAEETTTTAADSVAIRTNFPISEATGANSTLFMLYDTSADSDYTKSATLENYNPGIDYMSALNYGLDGNGAATNYCYPTGDFATDNANLQTKPSAFIYSIDAEKTSSNVSAEFKTKDGQTVWTINDVDYNINPTEKVFQLSSSVKTTNITDATKKTLYGRAASATFDIPDGNYDKIGFLATASYARTLKATFYYDDNTSEAIEFSLKEYASKYGDTSVSKTNGNVYLKSLESKANATRAFRVCEYDVNESKKVTKVVLYAYTYRAQCPIAVISSWGISEDVTAVLSDYSTETTVDASNYDAVKADIAKADSLLAQNGYTSADLGAENKAIYNALTAGIAAYDEALIEAKAEAIVKGERKTNFPISEANGANAKLFMASGSPGDKVDQDTSNDDMDFVFGIDYTGYVTYDTTNSRYLYTGVQATDLANNATNHGAVMYTIDKNPTKDSQILIDFKTRDYGTVWNINGVDYQIDPTEKIVKVYSNVKTADTLTDEVLKARYATLAGVTLDVPDGYYKTVSFLAGAHGLSSTRTLYAEFVYKDGTKSARESQAIDASPFSPSTEKYVSKGYVYARRINISDPSVNRSANGQIGFVPITYTTVDPNKELDKIIIKPSSRYNPVYVISAWGGNDSIETKLAELETIEVISDATLAVAETAIADFDAYLADMGYILADLGSYKAPYENLVARIAEYKANADRLNALYAGEKYTPVKLKIAEGKSAEGLVYGFEDPAYRIMSNTEENAAIYNIVKDKKYVSTRLLKDESYVPQTVAHWQQYDTTHTGLPTGIQFYSKELLNDKNEYTTPAGAKYVVNTFGDTDYNSAYLKLSTADNFVAEFDGVTPYNSVKLLLSAVDEPIWNGSGRNARAVTATINYADGTSEKKLVFIGSLYGYGAALSAKLKDSAEIRGHGLNTSLLANEKNINTAVDATGKVTTKAKTSAIYTNLTSGNISAAGKTTWSPFDYAENIWAEGMFYSSAYANTGSNAATQADRKAYILKKMTDGAGHFTSVTLDTKGKAVTSVTIGAVANDSHFDELCGESGAFRYSGDTNSMYYRVPLSDEAAKELLEGKSAPFGTLYKFDETGAVETETQTVNGTDYQIAKGYSNYTVEDCDVYLTVHAQASAHFVVLHAATGEKTYANVMERIEDANTKMREITVNSSYEEAKAIDELYKSTLALEIVREEDFDEAAVANFNIVYKAIRDKTNVSGKVEVLYYKGEAPEVKVEINNITTDAGKPYSVILAYYDEEGNYIASHIENRKSTASEKESFSITDENCPSNTMKVKAFLWKDFKTLIPLADAADSEVRTSLKVLAIGNSYSDDAQTYLTEIAQNAGLTDVIIGNAYIGGCSLSTHKGNIDSNKVAYWFRHKTIDEQGKIVKTSSGTKVEGSSSTLADKTLLECITAEDWDIITIQQASASSAKDDTYGSLQSIIDYVNEHKTNKNAKIGWHMTWAYTDNSTTLAERYPGMTQMDMYNGISNAVQTQVLPLKDISFVIPAGTAVQNARVPLGDTLIGSDNVHLNALGDYVAGLTWFAKLTGMSIDNITYTPNTDIANKLDTIKKAVKDAIANPYTVTK